MKIKTLIGVVAAFVVVFPSSFVMALEAPGVEAIIIGLNVTNNQQDNNGLDVKVDGERNIGVGCAGSNIANIRLDVSTHRVTDNSGTNNSTETQMSGSHNTGVAIAGPGNITATISNTNIDPNQMGNNSGNVVVGGPGNVANGSATDGNITTIGD